MLRNFLVVLLVCLIRLAPVQAATAATSSNGVWLSHSYVTTTTMVNKVPQVATLMTSNKVDYWFVNIGSLNSSGQLVNGVATCPKLKDLLNMIYSWEGSNGKQFKVFGWVSGNLDSALPNYIDVSQSTIRTAIVNECKKMVFPSTTGSYVVGALRQLDGIQIDLEPSGANDTQFNNLKMLMSSLRTGLGTGKLTSFCAHKYGTLNRFWWSSTYYHYMARYVDVLCAMTYNSNLTTAADYRTWMANQTKDILRAVSGKTWNNDAIHPAPPSTVKVLIGFPAFPASGSHSTTAETIVPAAQGTQDGLAALTAAGDNSGNYFSGASVYLHTDGSEGTGPNDYASEATDWANFHSVWLGL
jgi:hypothetical protein